ncbi:MAG: type II toxin-antitoxin system VapC family toxin [Acaryochloridaceae cyanobacterium RU_4_10]|nr:type II toxin-antitoxin system VapC family toxin [Acaryochloridaceae cyanobacterium RU_4_10]
MSQIIVLDTHIWFWLIAQEFDRFPASWRDEIETVEQVSISPVSCYEIALANQRGRLELPCSAEQWFENALTPSGISVLPLTAEVACRAVNLSAIHKDPFDRLIIATTLIYGAKLASVDSLFSQYSELNGCLMK